MTRYHTIHEALAFEAQVIASHVLDVKALSGGRRQMVEESIARMRALALGADVDATYGWYRFGLGRELQRLKDAHNADSANP